ncbi:hypothetical protein D3Z62_02645 [Lachnospiraceae bacterium]|nr:hypothetical protein [Lachnospiraceae bacterium]
MTLPHDGYARTVGLQSLCTKSLQTVHQAGICHEIRFMADPQRYLYGYANKWFICHVSASCCAVLVDIIQD